MVSGGPPASGIERRATRTDRAQAHTLEAFMAALLLVGSITFAFQITAVTPLTASTSSQHIENQQLQVARGLLDSAAENGSLVESVLNWNDSIGQFNGTIDEGYYATGGPPTTFGRMLNRTFGERGIAFNVEVHYVTTNGEVRSEEMVHVGSPSDHAVSVRRTVTLYDDDTLTTNASKTLNETSTFFAPDVDPDGHLYNVVRVEVVAWRM